jgi:hypothetical protein
MRLDNLVFISLGNSGLTPSLTSSLICCRIIHCYMEVPLRPLDNKSLQSWTHLLLLYMLVSSMMSPLLLSSINTIDPRKNPTWDVALFNLCCKAKQNRFSPCLQTTMDLIYHKTIVMVWVVNKIIIPLQINTINMILLLFIKNVFVWKATCKHLIQIQAEPV